MHICAILLDDTASTEDVVRSLKDKNVVIHPDTIGSSVFVSDHAIADRLSTLPNWHYVGCEALNDPGVICFITEDSPQEILNHLRQVFIDCSNITPLSSPDEFAEAFI